MQIDKTGRPDYGIDTMTKIAFKTIGCRLNQAEIQDLQAEFAQAGFEVVSPKEVSDFFVINTCSVTQVADRKSRQALREFKHRNPNSQIVVLGCGAEVQKHLPEVDLAIFNEEKERAFSIINSKLKIQSQKSKRNLKSRIETRRTRVLVKIQEGCAEGCTYCVVPKLRGKPLSIATSKIIEKVKKIENRGAEEIILTGVHIGQYRDGQVELPGLIKKILENTANLRVRLSSVEPQHFSKEILEIMAQERICPFLHLPIQSGSDSVLQAMGRNYRMQEITKLIGETRNKLPGIFLSTDIIVGFPGENEVDFGQTYDFCKQVAFAKIHVFRYSKREGTKAVALPGQIDPSVAIERSRKLRFLSEQLNFAFRSRLRGRDLKILMTKSDQGVSAEGILIKIPETKPVNSVQEVRINDVTPDTTLGKII